MGYHSPVDVPASIPTREIFAPLPALSTYDAPSASLTSSPSSHQAQKRSMDVPLRPASTRSPLPPVEGLSFDNILPGVPTGEFISLHQQETCSPPFQHPSGSEPTWFPVPQGRPMLAFVPSNPGSFQCHSAGFRPSAASSFPHLNFLSVAHMHYPLVLQAPIPINPPSFNGLDFLRHSLAPSNSPRLGARSTARMSSSSTKDARTLSSNSFRRSTPKSRSTSRPAETKEGGKETKKALEVDDAVVAGGGKKQRRGSISKEDRRKASKFLRSGSALE